MINEQLAKEYCSEDISKIANYEEAIADTTQIYVCHHILGEILTRQQLLDHDFYYNVPPCMLKFLSLSEHIKLHNSVRTLTPETKRKISESHKGKTLSTETKRKLSEAGKGRIGYWHGKIGPMKGRHCSEETKQKIREALARRRTD